MNTGFRNKMLTKGEKKDNAIGISGPGVTGPKPKALERPRPYGTVQTHWWESMRFHSWILFYILINMFYLSILFPICNDVLLAKFGRKIIYTICVRGGSYTEPNNLWSRTLPRTLILFYIWYYIWLYVSANLWSISKCYWSHSFEFAWTHKSSTRRLHQTHTAGIWTQSV